MRRILLIGLAIVAGGGAFALATGAGGGAAKPSYRVEFDNAFGLITGADVKVAGVRAGKIGQIEVNRRNAKALVAINLNGVTGSRAFRVDATCQSRPQSLIGEYFVDCQPGHAKKRLKAGAVIPVSHTQSTIPLDLINNILRLPYRERLRIIVGELGSGVAARGSDLNAAIRRAVPALRNTDALLNILYRQRLTIEDLTHNANTVVTALANNRGQVARFVDTANATATASASRRVALAETFRRLPGFLAQLIPTMRALGVVAQRQVPALRNLDAASPSLRRFLDDLAPFANASVPAVRSLGQTSIVGRSAVRAARPTVRLLNGFASGAPQLSRNLSIVLRHLDNRRYAVESDHRAANQQGVRYRPYNPRTGDAGTGYSGLEALLQYPFDQSLTLNGFDERFHILRLGLISNQCSTYTNATTFRTKTRANPTLYNRCGSPVGPSQPGINKPDPTGGGPANPGTATASAARRTSAPRAHGARRVAAKPGGAPRASTPAPGAGAGQGITRLLDRLVSQARPGSSAPRPRLPRLGGGSRAPSPQAQGDLLNFLLGP